MHALYPVPIQDQLNKALNSLKSNKLPIWISDDFKSINLPGVKIFFDNGKPYFQSQAGLGYPKQDLEAYIKSLDKQNADLEDHQPMVNIFRHDRKVFVELYNDRQALSARKPLLTITLGQTEKKEDYIILGGQKVFKDKQNTLQIKDGQRTFRYPANDRMIESILDDDLGEDAHNALTSFTEDIQGAVEVLNQNKSEITTPMLAVARGCVRVPLGKDNNSFIIPPPDPSDAPIRLGAADVEHPGAGVDDPAPSARDLGAGAGASPAPRGGFWSKLCSCSRGSVQEDRARG